MGCLLQPYSGLGGVYRALYGWIDEQGHEVAADPREVYTPSDRAPSGTVATVTSRVGNRAAR
jgi:effector-binding domain-containing protein